MTNVNDNHPKYSYWIKFIQHREKTELIIYSHYQNETFITDQIFIEDITTTELSEILKAILKGQKLPEKYPMKPC